MGLLIPKKKPDSDDQRLSLGVRFLRRYGLSGWKFGVLTCVAAATLICLVNIALTVSYHKVEDSISYLYTERCEKVARLNLWVHMRINIMSTLLLSASYCG